MSRIVTIKSGSHARMNPLHSGFAHGFGLFETIRISNGCLEFWKAHLRRFLDSATVFGLHFDQTEADLLDAVRGLVRAEGLRDGAVKLSLLKEGTGSCCYVYTRPVELPEGPVKLDFDTRLRMNEYSLLAGHKTHNYMESVHLYQIARSRGFFDVLRVNISEFLAETTTANVFIIKDWKLYTPAVSTGILPGVIRFEVLKAAERTSIFAEEGHYAIEFLQSADSVFLTNSSVGILPVSSMRIESTEIHYDVSNSVIKKLREALSISKTRKAIRLIDE